MHIHTHRALAAALAADNNNLRQLDSLRLSPIRNNRSHILQLIDNWQQMIQPTPHWPYQRCGHNNAKKARRRRNDSHVTKVVHAPFAINTKTL